jgi:hypothetical protein
MKLTSRAGKVVRRAECFVGLPWNEVSESIFTEEETEAETSLAEEVQQFLHSTPVSEAVAGWEPPAPERLTAWLIQAGYETATDKEQNLRLTLKRHGCDGQVRVERRPGRLRFVLPLGNWDRLEPPVEAALRRLTGLANDRLRLVRLAWRVKDDNHCCEAQVDLSGLPLPDDHHPSRERFWQQLVSRAVLGLHLALRQLGLELAVLADPAQDSLRVLLTDGDGVSG